MPLGPMGAARPTGRLDYEIVDAVDEAGCGGLSVLDNKKGSPKCLIN